MIRASFASHSRAAFSATTSNTGWRSVGELAITRRISAVAVCCSKASLSSRRRVSTSCFSLEQGSSRDGTGFFSFDFRDPFFEVSFVGIVLTTLLERQPFLPTSSLRLERSLPRIALKKGGKRSLKSAAASLLIWEAYTAAGQGCGYKPPGSRCPRLLTSRPRKA